MRFDLSVTYSYSLYCNYLVSTYVSDHDAFFTTKKEEKYFCSPFPTAVFFFFTSKVLLLLSLRPIQTLKLDYQFIMLDQVILSHSFL